MKRLHVSVHVTSLEESVRYYTTLFGAEPSLLKDDYAKWALDDPRVNFTIEARGHAPGLDHLGIEVEKSDEIEEIAGRLLAARLPFRERRETACCYARSEKAWSRDPQKLKWELFRTLGQIETFSDEQGNCD